MEVALFFLKFRSAKIRRYCETIPGNVDFLDKTVEINNLNTLFQS